MNKDEGIKIDGAVVALPQGGGQALLRINDLNIHPGSRVLIHGPSGAGKTTLLHLIAGLFLPNEGEVAIGGTRLSQLSDGERCEFRRKHFGIIFQSLNLLDHLTCEENILLSCGGGSDARASARRALGQVNMQDYDKRYAAHLSIGQRQRVAVARVIASRPLFVLADEPTSSLDDVNCSAVLDALLAVADKRTTLVVVSHDQRIKDRFSTHLDIQEFVAS